MRVKIPVTLATLVVKLRSQKAKYVTADRMQHYGLFMLLKAMAEKGQLKSYRQQLTLLSHYSHLSLRTINTLIIEMEALGLITRGRGNMYLASWRKVIQLTGGDADAPVHFHQFNYNEDDANIKPKYLVILAEEMDAKQRIAAGLNHSINNTPECVEAYKQLHQRFGLPAEFSAANLFRLQQQVFTHGCGAESYNDVFAVNPDVERSTRTIQARYNHKSILNVAYMRNRMEELGLYKVTKRYTPVFRYANKPTDAVHISNLLQLAALGTQATRGGGGTRVSKDHKRASLSSCYKGRKFSKVDNAVAWYMPYAITITNAVT